MQKKFQLNQDQDNILNMDKPNIPIIPTESEHFRITILHGYEAQETFNLQIPNQNYNYIKRQRTYPNIDIQYFTNCNKIYFTQQEQESGQNEQTSQQSISSGQENVEINIEGNSITIGNESSNTEKEQESDQNEQTSLQSNSFEQENVEINIEDNSITSGNESSNTEKESEIKQSKNENKQKVKRNKNIKKNKKNSVIQKVSIKNCTQNNIEQSQSNVEKNYKKNICRNMTKWIIQSIMDSSVDSSNSKLEYEKLLQICNQDNDILNDFRAYIRIKKENANFVNGPTAFKRFLLSNTDNDGQFINIFKEFSKWFVEFVALKHILLGNLKEKVAYINYKNDVFIRLIQTPEQWPFDKQTN